MKRILLTAIISGIVIISKAQTTDTVSVGAGYANQVWYSLSDDEQGSSPKNNWDIAFDAAGFGFSIMINSASSTILWCYPNADTSGWTTLDTTGIDSWEPRWNNDKFWELGAFSNYSDPNNQYDLDWGIYNQNTHFVMGDSLYVIQLGNGDYKKLWIESLISGTYNFRYADLDGSNEEVVALTKSNFAGKNFGYYSLQNNAEVDREPLSEHWDLVFGQYSALMPGVGGYTVTGVLQNYNVIVAECTDLADANSYANWGDHDFSENIDVIGYDWKKYSGSYIIEDSLVYFVKTDAGDIWKMIFTGFGGGTTGSIAFTKKLLSTVGISNELNDAVASMTIYPNPSASGNTNILYAIENVNSSANLFVYDLSGRVVFSDNLNTEAGLHQYRLSSDLKTGMYFVSMIVDGKRIQEKLIIK